MTDKGKIPFYPTYPADNSLDYFFEGGIIISDWWKGFFMFKNMSVCRDLKGLPSSTGLS